MEQIPNVETIYREERKRWLREEALKKRICRVRWRVDKVFLVIQYSVARVIIFVS